MATCTWPALEARLCGNSFRATHNLCPSRRSARFCFANGGPEKLSPSVSIPISVTRRERLPYDRCSDGLGGALLSAAIAVAGSISILSVASFAFASEVGESLIASSTEHLDTSLSITVPIPHQEIWALSQNGFIVPSPRSPIDGLITPFPRAGNDVLFGNFHCPKWTPSEFEMVLPDFNGRPKPFPRHGHQWPATFVVKGVHGEFLQASFLEVGLAFAESEASAGVVGSKEADQEDGEGKNSLPKPKASKRSSIVKQFRCYSL